MDRLARRRAGVLGSGDVMASARHAGHHSLIRSFREIGQRRSYRSRIGPKGTLRGGAGSSGCCIRLLYSRILVGVMAWSGSYSKCCWWATTRRPWVLWLRSAAVVAMWSGTGLRLLSRSPLSMDVGCGTRAAGASRSRTWHTPWSCSADISSRFARLVLHASEHSLDTLA